MDDKIRKYRIVLHNCDAYDKIIEDTVKKELGENIRIVGWNSERIIHYKERPDLRSGPMPQREIIVAIRYQEISEEEQVKQALKDKDIPLPPEREGKPLQSQIEQALKDKDVPLPPEREQ